MKECRFILNDDGTTTPISDIAHWAEWIENKNHRVALTEIKDVTISTIFLGISLEEPPILFETMIFGGEHDGAACRYQTKKDALEGHKQAVALVKHTQNKKQGRGRKL